MQLSRDLYGSVKSLDGGYAIQFVVNYLQDEKLSDFVRRIMHEKNLSYRAVANASGGLIQHTQVGDFINENYKIYSVPALQGLAKGLGEPEDLIFDLARGKRPNLSEITHQRFAEIAEKYVKLPEQIQKNLEPLLSAMELTINAQPIQEEQKQTSKKTSLKSKEVRVLNETVFEEKK